VLDGTLAEIQDRYGSDTIRISVDDATRLSDLPGVEQVRDFGQTQEIRIARDGDPQAILRALVSRTRVNRFTIEKPSLYDIFLRIAGPDTVVDEVEAPHA